MRTPLLVDVGNTRFKWAEAGPSPSGDILLLGEVETASVDADWMTDWARRHAERKIVAASVVPAISNLIRSTWPDAVLVDGGWDALPLAFDYPRPSEVGADRIAAAIGAIEWAPAVIINCGTATAFSALDRRGRFCGGAIIPGINTQLRSLQASTAQLPLGSLEVSPDLPGKSTNVAIAAGVLTGWCAAVVEIVTVLKREIGGMPQVLVAGGEAQHLRGVTGLGDVEFRPLLVFEGLRIIADSLSTR